MPAYPIDGGSSVPARGPGRTSPYSRAWPTLLLSIAGVVSGGIGRTQAATPLAVHPENPRYFLWRGKPTVLITSAEHYGAVLNGEFDYSVYLQELKRHGLNNTRTFSGVYREIPSSFGITENTLAPKPGHFVCPWARSNQPGESDGGNKFDLTRWNDAYFTRLKDFLRQAGEQGVVVELVLFCPMYNDDLWLACPMNARNNVNGVGNCNRQAVYALQHDDLTRVQLDFTRKIVHELRNFDNLYYEVCNEPYFGGVTMDWQHRIVQAVVEAEQGLSQPHLISLNIANGRQKVVDVHPDVSIFNFHYTHPPDTVALNAHLRKPIGENETGFRGRDDLLYRTEGWDFILAGGALYNNLDYSFSASHPAGTLRRFDSPGGGSLALRQQLGILKRLIDSFDFLKMAPDAAVVRQVSDGLVTQALVQPGESYLIYLHVPLAAKPKDMNDHIRRHVRAQLTLAIPPGDYSLEWIHTLTGEATPAASPNWTADGLKLETPAFDNDVALAIRRKASRGIEGR